MLDKTKRSRLPETCKVRDLADHLKLYPQLVNGAVREVTRARGEDGAIDEAASASIRREYLAGLGRIEQVQVLEHLWRRFNGAGSRYRGLAPGVRRLIDDVEQDMQQEQREWLMKALLETQQRSVLNEHRAEIVAAVARTSGVDDAERVLESLWPAPSDAEAQSSTPTRKA